MKEKTIGFFGGTFDPIHFGHINLALQLLEMHNLDEVLFCPVFCSPFKTAAPPHADAHHRLSMLQLAVAEIPRFRVSEYEISRKKPSYTIDTLRVLMERERGVIFRLLLSEEAALDFSEWKESQELIRLAPPLVGTRVSSVPGKRFPDALRHGLTCTKIFDISSTEIRFRLQKGAYCGHLVPSKTIDYIKTHQLYGIVLS